MQGFHAWQAILFSKIKGILADLFALAAHCFAGQQIAG